MASTKVNITYYDHSRERSRTTFEVGDLEFDSGTGASNLDDLETRATLIQDAIAQVTLCNFGDMNINHTLVSDTPTTPASQNAQREIALWIQGTDPDGNFHTMTIPGPDLTLIMQVGTDEVDHVSNLTAGALRAVLNANWKTGADQAITVTRMRVLGRRS